MEEGYRAGCCDTPDRITEVAGKPERSVGTDRDLLGGVPGTRVSGDHPTGGDPPDRAVSCIGEPERPVRSERYPIGAIDTRITEIRDDARGCDPANSAVRG